MDKSRKDASAVLAPVEGSCTEGSCIVLTQSREEDTFADSWVSEWLHKLLPTCINNLHIYSDPTWLSFDNWHLTFDKVNCLQTVDNENVSADQ